MSAHVSWLELEYSSAPLPFASVSWVEVEVETGVQYLYPTNDVVLNGWTPPPLWNKLNEVDTLEFITSSGTTFAELGLADPASVGAGDVIIQFSARKSSIATGEAVIRLMEGILTRATRTITLVSTSFVTYQFTLTPAEVATIVDWNNLRIRINHPQGS